MRITPAIMRTKTRLGAHRRMIERSSLTDALYWIFQRWVILRWKIQRNKIKDILSKDIYKLLMESNRFRSDIGKRFFVKSH